MSKSIKETFVTIINEGYKATEGITDPYQKATALANLGQALALSGLLSSATQITESNSKVEATGKESLKAESGKGTKSKSKSKAKEVKEELPSVTDIPPVQEEELEMPPVEEVIEPANVEEIIEETASEEISASAEENVEDEISSEWTEEMAELKAEQLELLGQYVDAWEASYVYGECIPAFFEDSSIVADEENYYEYIRPTNIDSFLAYLSSLASEE